MNVKKCSFYFVDSKNVLTFAALNETTKFNITYWRGGRVVDCTGLENRRTERYRGFESLSLRSKGCKSSSYEIYTLFYTQKSMLGVFFWLNVKF